MIEAIGEAWPYGALIIITAVYWYIVGYIFGKRKRRSEHEHQ